MCNKQKRNTLQRLIPSERYVDFAWLKSDYLFQHAKSTTYGLTKPIVLQVWCSALRQSGAPIIVCPTMVVVQTPTSYLGPLMEHVLNPAVPNARTAMSALAVKLSSTFNFGSWIPSQPCTAVLASLWVCLCRLYMSVPYVYVCCSRPCRLPTAHSPTLL